MPIISNHSDLIRLAPGVAEDKDVIGSNTKHDENGELVERGVHRDLEDASIKEVAQWE